MKIKKWIIIGIGSFFGSFIIFIIFLIVIALFSYQQLSQTLPTTKSSEETVTPSSEETVTPSKEYISRAGGYLNTLNKYDGIIAQTMVGVDTGETTLGEIKDAIKKAQYVEGYAWQVDYLNHEKLVVPPSFIILDTKIKDCRNLHISAWKELLEYWKDSNSAHIQSGMVTLQNAALLANECVIDLGVGIRSLEK